MESIVFLTSFSASLMHINGHRNDKPKVHKEHPQPK